MDDVNILDHLAIEPGAVYIMDRGYLDFARLARMAQALAFFVIWAKVNLKFYAVESRPVDKNRGLRCDQTIRLRGVPGVGKIGLSGKLTPGIFMPKIRLCSAAVAPVYSHLHISLRLS